MGLTGVCVCVCRYHTMQWDGGDASRFFQCTTDLEADERGEDGPEHEGEERVDRELAEDLWGAHEGEVVRRETVSKQFTNTERNTIGRPTFLGGGGYVCSGT